MLGDVVTTLASEFVGEERKVPYERAATQLTVLCQILPRKAKYDLQFKVSQVYEINPGDFSQVALSWCHEFLSFCRQWMKHAGDSTPELQ